jgi:hypothetical protein
MHFGLIVLSLVGEIAMLARAAFGIMILCLAIPVLRAMWSSLRTRPRSDDLPDLDALWTRYKRGEISWDEYLRGKIEGARGLAGTKAESLSNSTSDNAPYS